MSPHRKLKKIAWVGQDDEDNPPGPELWPVLRDGFLFEQTSLLAVGRLATPQGQNVQPTQHKRRSSRNINRLIKIPNDDWTEAQQATPDSTLP